MNDETRTLRQSLTHVATLLGIPTPQELLSPVLGLLTVQAAEVTVKNSQTMREALTLYANPDEWVQHVMWRRQHTRDCAHVWWSRSEEGYQVARNALTAVGEPLPSPTKYLCVLEKLTRNGTTKWGGFCMDLSSNVAQSTSREKVLKRLQEGMRITADSYLEDGELVPVSKSREADAHAFMKDVHDHYELVWLDLPAKGRS